MKIALDYDKTYNTDPHFWDAFVELSEVYGHEVRIVTARSPNHDRIDNRVNGLKVIYCDGVAKRFVCHFFAENYQGWDPDVWIDDKPESVDKNSNATKEILEKWRASEEYLK